MQLVNHAWPPMLDGRFGKRTNADERVNRWIMQQAYLKRQQTTLRVKMSTMPLQVMRKLRSLEASCWLEPLPNGWPMGIRRGNKRHEGGEREVEGKRGRENEAERGEGRGGLRGEREGLRGLGERRGASTSFTSAWCRVGWELQQAVQHCWM